MDHEIVDSALINKRSAKQRFREEIFSVWNGKCAYCGTLADTLDHIKPRYKGGTTTVSNLVPACRLCNQRKGSDPWFIWFRSQLSWTEDRELRILHWVAKPYHVVA